MEYRSASDFIDAVIISAYDAYASDIHLHPTETELLVRFRIHGSLTEVGRIPIRLHAELLARIKILSLLRIDEHHTPQDGRFQIHQSNRKDIYVRVSILPTQYGEQCVLRLLGSNESLTTLRDLGMNKRFRNKVQEILDKRKGLILVTGPTGSGKTSTLYALLRLLNTSDTSIVTIEDPIELSVDGMTQIPINNSAGLTFSLILRSVMRQDPDVIMVGEIRDRETAELAVHAALTGHLVLSTLHTNDSPTALVRLIDMGIEPYLVASTVELVIAQRLVPKKTISERIGIFEILHLNDSIREILRANTSRDEILNHIDTDSYASLKDDCVDKVMRNEVSHEAVRQYL